jgi:hypothetical protein
MNAEQSSSKSHPQLAMHGIRAVCSNVLLEGHMGIAGPAPCYLGPPMHTLNPLILAQ